MVLLTWIQITASSQRPLSPHGKLKRLFTEVHSIEFKQTGQQFPPLPGTLLHARVLRGSPEARDKVCWIERVAYPSAKQTVDDDTAAASPAARTDAAPSQQHGGRKPGPYVPPHQRQRQEQKYKEYMTLFSVRPLWTWCAMFLSIQLHQRQHQINYLKLLSSASVLQMLGFVVFKYPSHGQGDLKDTFFDNLRGGVSAVIG